MCSFYLHVLPAHGHTTGWSDRLQLMVWATLLLEEDPANHNSRSLSSKLNAASDARSTASPKPKAPSDREQRMVPSSHRRPGGHILPATASRAAADTPRAWEPPRVARHLVAAVATLTSHGVVSESFRAIHRGAACACESPTATSTAHRGSPARGRESGSIGHLQCDAGRRALVGSTSESHAGLRGGLKRGSVRSSGLRARHSRRIAPAPLPIQPTPFAAAAAPTIDQTVCAS